MFKINYIGEIVEGRSSSYDESYYNSARSEVINYVPENIATLLDVGCGGGFFGRELKNVRNVEVWGVEPIQKAADNAKKNIDKVVCGYFDETINLPSSYFDVITFNDSLEHFPDPFPPLALCKLLLKPASGVVVASIPNVRFIKNVKHFLFDKDWKYTDKGILDRTHLKFFTKKSMIRTFEEAGYEVISIEGINPHRWDILPILMLRIFFGKLIADMKYSQYVVVAKPI